MFGNRSPTLKTWPVAAAGFAGLLLLIVMSIQQSSSVAADIHANADRINANHHVIDGKLRRLRSAIHLSSIYVRDYLLDVANEHGDEYRQKLEEYRTQSRTAVGELKALMPDVQMRLLEGRLEDYWMSFDPLFRWTPAEKIRLSANFLRREVVPRREAVLAIAYEIEGLNESTVAAERADTELRYAEFQQNQTRVLWQSTAIGLIVAAVAAIRLRSLERRSDAQRRAAERAEGQMRELSQQLVAAQEDERKRLSRELHDHVAQVLTALRMELRQLDRGLPANEAAAGQRVAECLALVDRLFSTVRELALGLRPSMLDDFGLRPALEWLAGDFTRRSGLVVRLQLSGDLDSLPDQHRTCTYRVVQEALTNCVRHARASAATVSIRRLDDELDVVVCDDGIGLDPARRWTGLGLRGMDERVKELGGSLTIESTPGRGTSLTMALPVPVVREVHRESVAS